MTNFIFMLTQGDITVPNARQILDSVADLGLSYVGFKDLGLPATEQQALAADIRAAGAEAMIEIVSETASDEARSLGTAADLGVQWVLGGTAIDTATRILAGSAIRYCPFPGRPFGHPTRLPGPADSIVESARMLAATPGVHGLDLLAYRFDGEGADLARRVVDAVSVPVIAAGDVDSAARIRALQVTGVWGFTIGSAIVEGSLQMTADGRDPRSLITAVLQFLRGEPPPRTGMED
jgi:hypothetical protein